MLTIFQSAYIPASSFFEPLGAYHRWVTVLFVLLSGVAITQFLLRYPKNSHPRLSQAILVIHLIVAIVASGVFISKTIHAEKVYHFDGHYWDFDADVISHITGLVIFSYMITFYVLGYWRAYIFKNKNRWGAIGLTTGFLLSTLIPGVTNILSRDGALDRGAHQTTLVLFVAIGFFMVVMVYINTTRDQSTFMAKIVGISLLTILLVMQFVSYFSLQDKDQAYNAVHLKDVTLTLRGEAPSEDFKYEAVFDVKKGEAEFRQKRSGVSVALATHKNEYLNAYIRARIRKSGGESADEKAEKLSEILKQAHPYFDAYAAALRGRTEDEAEAWIEKNRRAILYRKNKVRKIPNEKFRANLIQLLNKEAKGEYGAIAKTLQERLKQLSAEGADLKQEILEYLKPAPASGERRFRNYAGEPGREPYVAFIRVDLEKSLVYEVGYSYISYRAFVHAAAVKIVYMLLAILVVVLVGFRIFFAGALVSPLKKLLEGVELVNKGDLDVTVPIKVADEIGFLSGSFNGMVASIREARVKLQEYAEHLEEKVEERTAELKQTLKEVQVLKTQQDGDYFLTSLLIKPLGANQAGEGDVNVDFLLKQKKQFTFRKWEEEIGGDLNKAHRITLKGKSYTVFLNADAMGKSMQGAGGILVLGSVFESLIERSRLSSTTSEQYPERWLKNAFIELQKVFESFNGSMLISLVMGLVDDEMGIMYFINAEHPFTVLYRNKKAVFIENELTFRKLGTQGMSGTIFVKTMQLEPGDVIIAGSDGRDDLVIGKDEEGNRIMNDDDQAFLTRVEDGGGDLEKIYRHLLQQGELSDDLSLLRIGYKDSGRGNSEVTVNRRLVELINQSRTYRKNNDLPAALRELHRALEMDNSRPELYYELMKVNLESKNYKAAALSAEDYVYLRPGDTEIVYVASVCFRKYGDLHKAADLGERVRLRMPESVKNLLNLARIYIKLENLNRADMLAEEALHFDPDNPQATRLKIRLSELKVQESSG